MKFIKGLILFLLIGCAKEPYQLVEQSMKLMEKNSINRDKIDWDIYPIKYIDYTKKINTQETAYQMITLGLKNLNDGHSMFVSKEIYDKYFGSKARIDTPIIDSILIDNKYGYIKIPSFISQDPKEAKKLALAIQKEIFNLDKENIQGWIIDLSENSGGNMWPMLAGLSPILKDGTLGYFYKGDDFIQWSFENNKLKENGKKRISSFNKKEILHNNIKIGVIIGEKTGSSGEALAIALKSQPNTMLFGKQTYGATTGNSVFKIKDGSRLAITTSILADSNKEIINGKITPDIVTNSPLEEIKLWIN